MYSTLELTAPADQPFLIVFDNQEAVPHDVDIRGSDGSVIKDQQPVTGPTQMIYEYDPLAAGEYVFICSIHPVPAMTGRLVVQ
jgi:plastocyanin